MFSAELTSRMALQLLVVARGMRRGDFVPQDAFLVSSVSVVVCARPVRGPPGASGLPLFVLHTFKYQD